MISFVLFKKNNVYEKNHVLVKKERQKCIDKKMKFRLNRYILSTYFKLYIFV